MIYLNYDCKSTALFFDEGFRWHLRIAYFGHYNRAYFYRAKPTKRQIRQAKRLYRKNPTRNVCENQDD